MKIKVRRPKESNEITTATIRLNKAVWDKLELQVAKTKEDNSPTKFISRQKFVELILSQALNDPNFTLDIPEEYTRTAKSTKTRSKTKKNS